MLLALDMLSLRWLLDSQQERSSCVLPFQNSSPSLSQTSLGPFPARPRQG